jgi:CDP-diglyceride synthetase
MPPMLQVLDALISVVVSLIIAFVVYSANYTQAFTYRWILLLALVGIAIGKALSIDERANNTMLYYWNIAYFILLLISGYLISLSHIDYANYGAYLMIFTTVVDVAVTVYGYTLNKKMMKDLSVLPTALVAIGDVLLLGGMAYAVSQS